MRRMSLATLSESPPRSTARVNDDSKPERNRFTEIGLETEWHDH